MTSPLHIKTALTTFTELTSSGCPITAICGFVAGTRPCPIRQTRFHSPALKAINTSQQRLELKENSLKKPHDKLAFTGTIESRLNMDANPKTDSPSQQTQFEQKALSLVSAPPAPSDALQTEIQDQPDTRAAHSVFSPRTKVFIILMTVFSTFFSPFSSFIYLPAITPIADAYNRPLGQINLTVTIYQVMQAIAPLFFGDLSDQVGRRPVYMLTFAIYLGANIGLALQNNYAALMVLRALQSTGSSATVAIGSAVVADLTTSAERGGYITAVQASVQFAPALAPVIGGILTQYLGWRSTFWFLTIAAGVFVLIYVPFVPEVSILVGRLMLNKGAFANPMWCFSLPGKSSATVQFAHQSSILPSLRICSGRKRQKMSKTVLMVLSSPPQAAKSQPIVEFLFRIYLLLSALHLRRMLAPSCSSCLSLLWLTMPCLFHCKMSSVASITSTIYK